MKEQLQDAHKFKLWKQNLEKNGLTVNGVEEIHTVHRYNGEVLFSLVTVDADTPEGNKIAPVCFLKGEVVSVLVVLIDESTREKYILLVKQRRICHGGYTYELVAGMVDMDDKPLDVAVRETEEESGIHVPPEQLFPLNDRPYFPSTGTCDEAMYFFYCELEMSKADIMSFHANHMGIASEHERIQTHIATVDEALKLIDNPNGLLAIYMYLAKQG